MRVTLTSPVEGKQPGDTVTVDSERGDWLIWQGYATRAGDVEPATEPAATPKKRRKASSS